MGLLLGASSPTLCARAVEIIGPTLAVSLTYIAPSPVGYKNNNRAALVMPYFEIRKMVDVYFIALSPSSVPFKYPRISRYLNRIFKKTSIARHSRIFG